jgi:DNA-binding response OmpR family regulator
MRYHPRGPLPSPQAFAMRNGQSLHNIPVGLPRVLIIEDEPLIVELIEDMVCELGYTVSGNARTVSAARQELAKRNFDTVLLDIGLDGTHSPEIADLLLEMRIPFGFSTGYNYPFEARHVGVPLLLKPFTPAQLRTFLETLVGSPRSSYKMAQARVPRSAILRAFSMWKTGSGLIGRNGSVGR